jgi:hypothetical protein
VLDRFLRNNDAYGKHLCVAARDIPEMEWDRHADRNSVHRLGEVTGIESPRRVAILPAPDSPAGRSSCSRITSASPNMVRNHDGDVCRMLPASVLCRRRHVCRLLAPPVHGRYVLEFDLVCEMVCWFARNGSATVRIPITII